MGVGQMVQPSARALGKGRRNWVKIEKRGKTAFSAYSSPPPFQTRNSSGASSRLSPSCRNETANLVKLLRQTNRPWPAGGELQRKRVVENGRACSTMRRPRAGKSHAEEGRQVAPRPGRQAAGGRNIVIDAKARVPTI